MRFLIIATVFVTIMLASSGYAAPKHEIRSCYLFTHNPDLDLNNAQLAINYKRKFKMSDYENTIHLYSVAGVARRFSGVGTRKDTSTIDGVLKYDRFVDEYEGTISGM